MIEAGLATWSGALDGKQSLIVRGQANLLKDVDGLENLERIRQLFDDLETKRDLVQLLGLAERGEGVHIFIGSENKLFSLSGSSLDRRALRGRAAQDRGRARRDRPDAPQLCPHHSDGGLHGQARRAGADLIFSRLVRYGRNRTTAAPATLPQRTQRGGREITEAGSDDDQYTTQRFRAEEERRGRSRRASSRGQQRPRKGGAEDGARTVHDVIAALHAEAADLKDKWLRAHAEIENIRKRAEREKEETAKYAVTRLASDIVNVGDNFQRAIDAVPAGAAEQDPALKSFLEGVTMTERELLNVLERHGIKRMQPMQRAVQPAPASGGHGDPAHRRAGRHRRAGVPGRLHHRGPRAAAGHGRRRQGRPEVASCRRLGACHAAGQRERAVRQAIRPISDRVRSFS